MKEETPRRGWLHRKIRWLAVAFGPNEASGVRQRQRARWSVRHGLVLTPLLLAGCAPGAFLSESGPTRGAIVRGASQVVRETGPDSRVKYAIVQVNDGVLRHMAQTEVPALIELGEHADYKGEVGVGDIIGLTIFESASGGLFLPRDPGSRAGNYITLPNQQVDRDGDITVPYAGKVRAFGLLPAELGTRIEARLSGRALEPQVLVTIIDRRAGPVSVLGEVGKATSFTLDPPGVSLLYAVAKAEGPKYPAYESVVTLQRDGRVWRIRLSDIAGNPGLNMQLRPGDTVYVSHEQQYFVAMGAIGQSGSLGPVDRRLPFQDRDLTLMDALGRAGGLNDSLANSRAIFIYRLEPRTAINLAASGSVAAPELAAAVPTVYLVDLNDPAGFFYASRFPVHGEDVLYVANAPASDLQKFLTLMIGATASSAAVRETAQPYPTP
jgi:polysaccharide export outer membrane protein